MTKGLVTVFGANGFLGRHVLRELVREGWRVRAAVRRPHIAQDLRLSGKVGQIHLVQANLRFKASVEHAIKGADAVINLASISHKAGSQTFNAVHVLGAKTVAEVAHAHGITNLVQISSLSADVDAECSYAKSKADGETAVTTALPTANIVRTATLYGEGVGVFKNIARLAQLSPVIPLLGGGNNRLQPVYVGDVAEAVAKVITQGSTGKTFELAGPETYSVKELIAFTLQTVDKKRALIPMPWIAGTLFGLGFEILGAIPLLNLLIKPFITRDMVKGMKGDVVLSGEHAGFAELGVHVETIEAIIPPTLEVFKTYGQFHKEAEN